MKRYAFVFLSLFFILFMVSGSRAQKLGLDDRQEIEVTADRLEYDAERKLLIGSGNVLVSQGTGSLQADFVTVHTVSEEVYAAGNVMFKDLDRTWQGDELTYNFKTEQGDFGEFNAYVNPLYIRAKDSERVTPELFTIQDVFISSCEGEKPEFYITAEEASIENERYIRAKNAVFRLGGVPIFYFPYYKYDLERGSHWDFLPGYRSKWGAFLLSTYNMRVNGWMHSATHLDVRTDRGAAIGQDFKWETPQLKGGIKGYYTHDSDPHQDEDLTEQEKKLIDEDRYRIQLSHVQSLTDQDYVIANIDYVSDPQFMDDFFTREYEDNVQPENYVSFTHVDDRYIAGLLINKRLNDFYENVNRVPEATFDMRRQEILDSGFYYEGNNSATFLEKEFSELDDEKKYSTFRLDTRHMIYYPTKHFGFLNVTPRAGYEGTYYEKTKKTEYVDETIAIVATNVVNGNTVTETTFTNKTRTVISDGNSEWRNLPELGFDISYQAFKILEAAGQTDGGLRHVAEPYAGYTFIPEPNVEPEDLYQFDAIDELGKQNTIRLGMRNKLQTKRNGSVANLLNLNVFMDYHFSADEDKGEENIGPVGFDAESYPLEDLKIKIDGSFGTHGESFSNFNAYATYKAFDLSKFGLEYRYRKNYNDLYTVSLDLFPEETWSIGAYWRYQVLGANMEEQTYYIGHRSDCLGKRFGYTGRGNDWDIWFQIWLIALPDSQVGSSLSY
ncbi:MAG: LPS assembly protein LptD [Kiritimatiellae bacterium]|nr:LPS assembly protein LptD [Kiritimatiellia bacterium]